MSEFRVIGGPARVLDCISELRREHSTFREMREKVVRGQKQLSAPDMQGLLLSIVFTKPDVLARTSPLWIANDMVQVLKHASASLPAFSFDPALLLWEDAAAFAGVPLLADATADGVTRSIVGIQWARADESTWFVGALAHDDSGELYYRITLMLKRGDNMGDAASLDTDGTVTRPKASEYIRLLCALWLLLRQRVAVRRVEQADRATRRRFERISAAEAPSITIVELRKPVAQPGGDDAQHQPVDWSHRWMVGGHWRNQFHPSDKSHVPTWIAPYVKGPDDKPLVVKDKVYAWVR